MRHRTLDEMISYFNQQVSEMDINQSYKIQLLGIVTAIAYSVQKPQWIPMSEREPESGNYLTTFRKRGDPEDKRDVAIDLYWSGGWDDDGIDGNDTVFETLAWMPLPEPYKGDK